MSLIAICLGIEKYRPLAGMMRLVKTPVTRKEKAVSIRQQILDLAESNEEVTTGCVMDELGLTYQSAKYHIRVLVDGGNLIKNDERLTDGAWLCFYRIPEWK